MRHLRSVHRSSRARNPLKPHHISAMVRSKGLGAASMIKSELIAKLASENPHLTQRDVERVVTVILDSMTDALEKGGRVELRERLNAD